MLKNLSMELKVGIFTTVAVATLGYMIFVLSPSLLRRENMKTYLTSLKDAAGIIPKTHVKTNGVTVGKVKSVELDVNSTRILMEVEAKIKIPEGSKIEVRTRGLLGDVFLEIIRAEDSGRYIEEGGFIPKSDDAMDLQAVIALVGSIGKDVKKVTNTLANVLGTQDGERSMKEILDNIERLTADLRKTGETIRHAIGDREEDVQDIVSNIQGTMADLRAFTKNLREALNDENKARLDRIIANFDDSMVDVKSATKNVRLIAERIEKGEGTLGKLVNDDSTIEEIKGAVKDIREVLAPVTKTQLIIDGHMEGRKDRTSQTYFNIIFKTRPDRFYLVGLTDVNDTETETVTESIPTDKPGQTGTREVVTERKSMRFNVQLGARWYNTGLRIGLFESTGGLAADLYLFADNVKFSVEAFNWKTYRNEIRRAAHIKAYATILFFNHIYAMVGWDDITRTHDPKTREETKIKNFFAGLGLTFNDQDLKTLFGAAALAR